MDIRNKVLSLLAGGKEIPSDEEIKETSTHLSIFLSLIFIVPIVILGYFNELSYIQTNETINIVAEKSIISVDINKIDSNNDGKLVHIIADAKDISAPYIEDEKFLIKTNALKLVRIVDMFQWEETGKNHKLYKKRWRGYKIDPSKFSPIWNSIEKRTNPSTKKNSFILINNSIKIGEVYISPEIIKMIKTEDLILKELKTPVGYKIKDNKYYSSKDIENPEIGDERISFKYSPIKALTIIGEQQGNKIVPHITKHGSITSIEYGIYSPEALIQKDLYIIKLQLWSFRIVIFLVILMFSPLIYNGMLFLILKEKSDTAKKASKIYYVFQTLFFYLIIISSVYYPKITIFAGIIISFLVIENLIKSKLDTK